MTTDSDMQAQIDLATLSQQEGCTLWARTEDYEREARAIKGVSRIIVHGSAQVVIFRADRLALMVAGESGEAIRHIKTTVADDTLVIEQEGNVVSAAGGSVHVSGSGNIVAGGNVYINGERVSCGANLSGSGAIVWLALPNTPSIQTIGSGDVTLYGLKQQSIKLDVQGSGDIAASGQVADMRATVYGSGDIDLSKLRAITGNLFAMGSGDVTAHVTDAVSACVMGSGDIIVLGSPAQRSCQVSGSGDIRFK